MKIRPAVKDDLEQLIQLRLDYFQEAEIYSPKGNGEPGFSPPIPAIGRSVLKEYFTQCLGRSLFAFLAELDGSVAGTAFLIIFDWPPSPAVPGGRMGRVANVLTYPPYRRQGVAGKLMLRLIEEARRLKVSRLDLLATASGEELYLKLGFTKPEGHINLQLPLDI